MRAAPIESAQAGEITFVANPRYRRHLKTTRASAVIIARDAPPAGIAMLRAADPYLAFARAIGQFHQPMREEPGIHPTAIVAATARLGSRAAVGPYAVIGERVRIGTDACIGPNVVIYADTIIGDRFRAYAHVTVRERVRIGDDVVLQSGVVIGGEGFGYVAAEDGRVEPLPAAGDVILEDRVEVGANTTIDRATVGSTIVRRGVKLDNLVMIAHGCELGEGSMLAAQVGLSGSTKVGRFVRMGGQAGSAGHLSIGDGAQVAAQSGLHSDVSAGSTVGGSPATDITLWRRMWAGCLRLPDLIRRVRRLEKALGAKVSEDEQT